MAIVLSINGSPVTMDEGSLSIDQAANDIDRLTVSVTSGDGSVRPEQDDTIDVSKDGTTIFGGLIINTVESGLGGVGLAPITTAITAHDYNALTERRYYSGTIPAGTLKAALIVLVAYLAPFGTTLSASQVDGPSLPELTFENAKLTEVFASLHLLSNGYLRDIDADNVLSMVPPGSMSASFAITDDGGHIDGDLVIGRQPRTAYANRVILRCGPSGTWATTQTWTATGSEDAWTTDLPAGTPDPGYVTVGGVYKTVGVGGQYTWDQATHTLTRGTDPRPGAGVVIELAFSAQGPFTVQADDEDEQGEEEERLYEIALTAESIVSYDMAIATVASELARRTANPRTASYSTYVDGLKPGQTQTITSTLRHVSASFLIQSIRISDERQRLRYDVQAVEGTKTQRTFRDDYDTWAGSSGSASSVLVSGGSSGGAAPSSPFPLGGSRSQPLELGTAAWFAAPEYQRFEAPATGTVKVMVDLWAMEAGVSCTARIYSLTDGVPLTPTSSAVTSTTPTATSFVVAVEAGKDYCLQLLAGTNAKAVFGIGTGRYL